MEKKEQEPVKKGTQDTEKPNDVSVEKEFDADEETHRTSPDLIQKESHRLPVDDEVKKG